MRKRKAETQDNERLSKRLSLLNLEKNGQKLYVPVESPQPHDPTVAPPAIPSPSPAGGASSPATVPPAETRDPMHLDDSKHKVYIYNLDDELSSSPSSSASSSPYSSDTEDNGGPRPGRKGQRLILLPNIHRHLLANRIPPSVLANQDGELAGVNANDMQMVLYSDGLPSSLTVAPGQDSVRRAVLEARERTRRRREAKEGEDEDGEPICTGTRAAPPPQPTTTGTGAVNVGLFADRNTPFQPMSSWQEPVDDDADAMDLD